MPTSRVFTLFLLAVLTGSAFAAPFAIRLPAEPKPWEKTAQDELSTYLKRIVKGSLSVDGATNVVFHVGDTPLAAEKGLTSSLMADEQWIIRSYGTDVLLNGGGTHGALFAVYHFLEDACGVRWWSQIEEDVPETTALALPKLDRTGRPAFPVRIEWSCPREKLSHFSAIRTRISENYGTTYPVSLGGGFSFGSPGGCHTFNRYLPPTEYGKAHPDWFELNRRTGARNLMSEAQPCLTHPDVRAHFKRRLREFVENDRAKAKSRGMPAPWLYDISQNDTMTYCECDACRTAVEKWGLSGLVLDFVNDIAASVKDYAPEVVVQTFAYQWSVEPPKGGKRAADNVMVRFCDTCSNQAAGVFEDDNAPIRAQIAGWAKAARRLSVWDYSATYPSTVGGLPFPIETHYAEMFRLCLVNGVQCYLIQGDSPVRSDMWELKYYLETKLMEDPYLDNEALIATFMREYYGPAGDEVAAYRRRLEELRRQRKGFVGWFPGVQNFDWLTDADLDGFVAGLQRGIAATGGREPYAARAKRALVNVDRLILLRARTRGGEMTAGEKAAESRLRAFWPTWIARWKSLSEDERKRVFYSVVSAPKPKAFADREIVDFPGCLVVCREEVGMRRVKDPESEFGEAVEEPRDDPSAKLPHTFLVYSFGKKKTLCSASYDKPLVPKGYAWYRVGEADLAKDTDLILSSWHLSLRVKYCSELFGKRWEIFVSAKFTGPKYYPGSTEPNAVRIDRVVLVPKGLSAEAK